MTRRVIGTSPHHFRTHLGREANPWAAACGRGGTQPTTTRDAGLVDCVHCLRVLGRERKEGRDVER